MSEYTSPTAGLNLGQRIAHVGGRITESQRVEFGSVMAVSALVAHALQDLTLAGVKAVQDIQAEHQCQISKCWATREYLIQEAGLVQAEVEQQDGLESLKVALPSQPDPATMVPPWTVESQSAAKAEGWHVTHHEAPIYGPWQVERIDNSEEEAALLKDDNAAWKVAATGTEPHHTAVRAFLKVHNPAEYASLQELGAPDVD